MWTLLENHPSVLIDGMAYYFKAFMWSLNYLPVPRNCVVYSELSGGPWSHFLFFVRIGELLEVLKEMEKREKEEERCEKLEESGRPADRDPSINSDPQ